MEPLSFYTAGNTPALSYAAAALERLGWKRCDGGRVLVLPVPSFQPDGTLMGGGELPDLSGTDTLVFGGNLDRAALHCCRRIDLLKNPTYLAQNAAITAHCAIRYALEQLPVTLDGQNVLVIGWGRIGKCLSALLKRLGARVSVYARKESDRAMLTALGYSAGDLTRPQLYRVIYNTAPVPLLPEARLTASQVKIDLASVRGMEGDDVIWARGLPNKDAPESSGSLIARSVDAIGKEILL